MVLQYSLWFKFKKGVASRLRFNNSMRARGAYKRNSVDRIPCGRLSIDELQHAEAQIVTYVQALPNLSPGESEKGKLKIISLFGSVCRLRPFLDGAGILQLVVGFKILHRITNRNINCCYLQSTRLPSCSLWMFMSLLVI